MPVEAFLHCNVNCSDLGLAARFYAELGFAAVASRGPAEEDPALYGTSSPLRRRGWMFLKHRESRHAPGLSLLSWDRPGTGEPPYREAHHLGFVRLTVLVPDLEEALAGLERSGIRPARPPAGGQMPFALLADPDGGQVLIMQAPVPGRRFGGVTLNCRDLAASTVWYAERLGLERLGAAMPGAPDAAALGLAGPVGMSVQRMGAPGARGFTLALEQWVEPEPVGEPYADPSHLGIYRVALRVEGLDALVRALVHDGVDVSVPPRAMDDDPDSDLAGMRMALIRDPQGACVELVEIPRRH